MDNMYDMKLFIVPLVRKKGLLVKEKGKQI